jgi:hypothetical protein
MHAPIGEGMNNPYMVIDLTANPTSSTVQGANTSNSNASSFQAPSVASAAVPQAAAKFIVPLESLQQAESELTRLMSLPNAALRPLAPLPFSALTPGLVEREVVRNGRPLYIQGVCKNWNRELFRLGLESDCIV